MDNKKNSIFRKQALDRVSSPEELDRYLVVTRPGVWFALLSIIVLLAGMLAWAVLGRLEMRVNVAVEASNGDTVCYVPAESAEDVLSRGLIKVADKEYTVVNGGYSKRIVSSDMDANIRFAGELSEGDVIIPLKVEGQFADGIYEGEVVIEVIKPISFIIN